MLTMMGVRRFGIVSVLSALFLWCASPASATFRGRNGALVMSSWPYPAASAVFANTLTFINPRTGQARRMGLCPAESTSPNSGCEGEGAAAVSPDGRRIAFVMSAGPTAYHAPTEYALALLPFGGGASVKYPLIHRPQDPGFPYYQGLAWSPDGSRLVLGGSADDGEGGPQLSFLNTDGRLTGRIVRNAAAPDWSPDGRLAFSRHANSFDTDHDDLFVGKPSGRFRRLTRKGGISPSWSPDGRRIAFLRSGAILVMPSRGGRARRVVAAGPRVDTFGGAPTRAYTWGAPAWSPDGRQIASIRSFHRRQNSELHTFNLKSKRLRRLYDGIQPSDQVFSLDWQALPAREAP
jgi:WD40 repeat protein